MAQWRILQQRVKSILSDYSIVTYLKSKIRRTRATGGAICQLIQAVTQASEKERKKERERYERERKKERERSEREIGERWEKERKMRERSERDRERSDRERVKEREL